MHRASASGRLRSTPPLRIDALASVLRHAAHRRDYPCDLGGPGGAPFTRLVLLAQHVHGLAPGTYDYDEERHALTLVREGAHSRELQEISTATLYNWEQAAAVLVVVARISDALATYGNRALRIVNADVGTIAQRAYLACTALGAGVGASLGYPNAVVDGFVGLEAGVESAMILVAFGNQTPDASAFRSHVMSA
jgi:SagB-type dehydrogenase family enzyme